MARPTPLSGFPEYLPAQRIVEQQVLAHLARTFELHGFANIETRAVEPLDTLLSKGETSKEVYVLRRLQESSADGHAGMGLHFDLTVPLARYVLENAGHLEFPFRRYQIQKVWRGERPQEGRYREFVQADIDVIGRDTLGFHHDVDVARVMVDALGGLDFLPGFTLQVNNRKLIQGFYAGLGAADPAAVMRVVDKLDKVPAEVVGRLLIEEAGLTPEQADQCLALAGIYTPDDSFVDHVRALGVEHPLLDEGLTELAAVVNGCVGLVNDRVQVMADLKIARGLDYYTGTVFETRLRGYEGLGSICSGGRYDELAADTRSTYPGVGISFGVTRVLAPLFARSGLRADRTVPSVVFVALPDETERERCAALADRLRARGLPVEVSADPAKYGKQIRLAERRGIPYVVFPGEPDQIKNIRTGEQIDLDAESWWPAADQLTPQIRSDVSLSSFVSAAVMGD